MIGLPQCAQIIVVPVIGLPSFALVVGDGRSAAPVRTYQLAFSDRHTARFVTPPLHPP